MSDNENKMVISDPLKSLSEQAIARRNFLKWGLVGGLGLLSAWHMFVRFGQNRTYFTFGFDRLADDPQWLNERSFDSILQKRPASMHFFGPDSFLVFSNEVHLNFFASSENISAKNLVVEGKLILSNNAIVEGPAICYEVRPPQKPQRASAPVGMGVPMILPAPNEYNISFPSNVDSAQLRRAEWTVSVFC